MKVPRLSRFVAPAAVATGAGLVLSAPWMRRWGATRAEVRQALPGDALIQKPLYQATRAITIRAPAASIWSWLVQLGQGRGGFYSYDWLQNLAGIAVHSADRIIPEFQHLNAGDIVRLAPNIGMVVAIVEPARALVIRSVADIATRRLIDRSDPRYFDWTWAFVLEGAGGDGTRLIVRERAAFVPSAGMMVLGTLAYGPIDFVMSRKMLLSLKQRAEREG